ncbi:Regulation of nuclear pre-mRNA domain-containing protein 2, partial [Pseudolycoriella hygida]
MSAWCLKNRTNHKKIVSSWLNVLKQVKVEHRLTLFHLANDVIQHSKRKNYEFVDSWGTTLQKATTMVRDEKVKNKIIRIFNIWDQRGVYNEEFLTDLHNLISINPINQRQQQAESDDEQQASIISDHIRNCVRNEKETDKSFKILLKTPLCDTENIHSLKDRKHVEDVKREIDDHMHKLEHYIRALNTEIKARTILIAVLEQTDAFYHNQRGEVKVVANAYRNFGNRIKTMKRKLDELCTKLPSPIPSPDINAPSPEPDNDFDLLELSHNFLNKTNNGFLGFADSGNLPFNISDFKAESPKTDAQPIQVIGSSSIAKDLTDFNIDEFFKSIMPESYSPNPPQPVPPVSNDYNLPAMYGEGPRYTSPQQNMPFRPPPPQGGYRPPPMPPTNPYNSSPARPPPNSHYGAQPNQNFNPSFNSTMSNYSHPPRPRYPLNQSNFNNHMPLAPPPVPPVFDGNLSDEYNPESWDLDMSWNNSQADSFNQTIETPVSPPHFEREGRSESVVEYIDHGHDSESVTQNTSDVDHRQLRLPSAPNLLNTEKGRSVDVDHRNLISLTGSPPIRKSDGEAADATKSTDLWKGDMDFRKILEITESLKEEFPPVDSDYRINPHIHDNMHKQIGDAEESNSSTKVSSSDTIIGDSSIRIPGLSSPPPATLPQRATPLKGNTKGGHFRKSQNGNDNVESIDMEMSDEDFEDFPDFSFDGDEIDKKIDKKSNTALEANAKSSENVIDQMSKGNDDQKAGHSILQQSNEENSPNQNTKDVNAELHFRSINMFNSPPPNFTRPPPGPPPLLNPNFFSPPNRFWGNSPPSLNQNKSMQPPNRWNSPNFDRQRFNRPPPDFGMESRTNQPMNEDDDGDNNVREDEHNSREDDRVGSANFDDAPEREHNDGDVNDPQQISENQNSTAPKRHNPFSQIPKIPTNDERDFVPNKANHRPLLDDRDQSPRFNSFRPGPMNGPPNNQQSPPFNRNNQHF